MTAQTLAPRPAGHGPQTTVEVLHGCEAFDALFDEWTALFCRSALPHQLFQSPRLLRIWRESYPDAGDSVLVTARHGDALVGVLPLVRRSTLGVRRICAMGLPIAQFSDMIVDGAKAADAADRIWQAALALEGDTLELPRIRSDSELWRMRDGALVTDATAAPFACLLRRVDDDGPGSAYSARDRSSFRRRVRRLQDRGQVAFRCAQSRDSGVALAGLAVTMKRSSLESAGIRATAVRASGFEQFFRRAAADGHCGLMVSAIEVDGQPVGIDLSFLFKGVGFGHVMATLPSYQKEGLGGLLVHHVFASAKRQGARIFDLLPPADDYKLRHADGVTAVESRVYPLTTRGHLFATAFHRLIVPSARTLLR